MPKRINRWRYDKQLVESLATTQSELDTTRSELNTAKAAVVQVGDILLLSNSTIRAGYLLCNGANVSRTTYAALFAKIGTTYGVGDGSTTFTLPNMNNRYPIGPGTNALGKYINEQLPNVTHSHTVDDYYGYNNQTYTGGADAWLTNANTCSTRTTSWHSLSWGSSVYVDSGRVYPYSLALYYVIKC